jgi:para-aminobenzoate synthetase/4-amino-4-deoxychorismate lyase
MEIIRELESMPRGVYCGAIGAFSPDSTATFNVAIRTITISENNGVLGVGSAIVADSTSSAEYDECLLKARYFAEERSSIGLIETLRYQPSKGFLRVDRHLARLESGAASLDISLDKKAALKAMEAAVQNSTVDLRVRLQLLEDGRLEVAAQALEVPAPDAVWKYVVSEHFVQSEDMLARHKTNWRDLYNSERAKWSDRGVDEVLFLNQRGEIAEASASNVFANVGGTLVTPPLSCGALDGCLRQELIEGGDCVERVLRLEDLERADALYFGNSVRGLVRAEAHPRD